MVDLTNKSKIVKAHDLYDSDLAAQRIVSTISLPSLGGKRRVHNDGMVMLDQHYNLKETEQKYSIMENRLKRLEEEEKRAHKNQMMAEKKASDMMNARARHY
jgi:hypothetical protein